jgi:hypothetical protein
MEVDRMMTEAQRSLSFEIGARWRGVSFPGSIGRCLAGRREKSGRACGNQQDDRFESACANRWRLRARRDDPMPQPKPVHQANEERAAGGGQNIVAKSNPWVRLIPNDRELTLRWLAPTAVSGTLNVPVGRLRTLALGRDF